MTTPSPSAGSVNSFAIVSNSAVEFTSDRYNSSNPGVLRGTLTFDFSSTGPLAGSLTVTGGGSIGNIDGSGYVFTLPVGLEWVSFTETRDTFSIPTGGTGTWSSSIDAPREVSLSTASFQIGGSGAGTASFNFTVAPVTAVPEPSTYLLASAGFAVLALRRRQIAKASR